jgi:hypothetical protein
MNQTGILLPAMTLVGWTLLVLLLVAYQRFKALFARQVTADDFKLGESSNVPLVASIPNRNFMNLLEVPVLFYVVCITLYATQTADSVAVALAWSYFGLRVLHSLVYLTYNKVAHRLSFFAASNLALAVLWIRLVIELSK